MTPDERQAAAERIRAGVSDRPPTWWWQMTSDAALEMLDDALAQADMHAAEEAEFSLTRLGCATDWHEWPCPDAARADAQIARLDRLWSA